MIDKRNDLGKIIKQQRLMMRLTFQELVRLSGVSASHLGRIEKGTRFPSARILRKIANPLRFSEGKLFTLAEYLSPQPSSIAESPSNEQLDPYVAGVLSQEPIEVQRTVIAILNIVKTIGPLLKAVPREE